MSPEMKPEAAPVLDPRRFRQVMGTYPTGVSLITATGADGEPLGMIVGSFTSVSIDPPLVAYFPDKNSSSYAKLRGASSFVVNVLGAEQEDVCRTFASKSVTDKWSRVSWSETPSGSPIIDGAMAWIDCDLVSETDAGDHYLVMGRVRDLDNPGDGLPLVFFQGGYGKFATRSIVASTEPDLLSHLRVVDAARPVMERLSEVTGLDCSAQVVVGDELVIAAGSGSGPNPVGASARVGMRLPAIPPFGALFVAWGPDAEVDSWIGRLSDGVDPETVTDLREVLDRIRRDRSTVNLRPPADLANRIDRLMEGFEPGPAFVETLRRLVEGMGTTYGVMHVEPTFSYDVRFISAPVFDSEGTPVMLLRLSGFPASVVGRRVIELRSEVIAAADRVTARINGRVPE